MYQVWLSSYPCSCVADDFSWFNSGKVSYSNFEDQEDMEVTDTCAAMSLRSGEWVKVSCSTDTEHGVVCEAANSKGHLKCGGLHPTPDVA